MTEAATTEQRQQEAKDRAAFTRFRVMAFITGTMLLLLTLEMVLKYVFHLGGVGPSGSPNAVIGGWVPFVHGWIYVVYAISVFDLWARMRWSLGRIAALLAAGVVPGLSFYMEGRAKKWFAESLQEKYGSAEGS